MILPVIRDLAGKYTLAQLNEAATLYENERKNVYNVQGNDEGEVLTNLLMAAEVRSRMETQGLSLQDALREHTRLIQRIIKPKKK